MVYAKESKVVYFKGTNSTIRQGVSYQDDSEIVKMYPELFEKREEIKTKQPKEIKEKQEELVLLTEEPIAEAIVTVEPVKEKPKKKSRRGGRKSTED